MAISNLERVGKGLAILKNVIAPYIQRELKSVYKETWWKNSIEPALENNVGRDALAGNGTFEEKFARLDIQALLVIMWQNWDSAFRNQLGFIGRNYVSELREVRNKWAHQQPFSSDDTFRALDTITRLLELSGLQGGEELKTLSQEMLRQRFETEVQKEVKKTTSNLTKGATQGFKSWREVATPHPDVASGQYQQAEFAADLAQVITGTATGEYGNAKEFFQRTYLTEGLTRLLSRTWSRLMANGGDPVIELQTNFGGGKTHSMLALYHLFGGEITPEDIPGLESLVPDNLKETKIRLPVACRAVLVGTQITASEVREKPDGIKVRTLWGEMAWQLGKSINDAAGAYQMVAKADQEGVSPGSDVITELFAKYGPALVLIDEWVAFARNIYGKDNLPAGNFESNLTFVQVLTEAAKAAKDAIVVAAIPASNIEIGGEAGKIALDCIQNTFGRLEAVWKPASATESFEIVRRRLFEPIKDHVSRDAVCRAFSDLYQTNRAEFPPDCREAGYEERLKSAYPIHPELFDRLYEDWSTLERFQRTRGVLRIMAAIIHSLWENQDGSLLIMPSTIPMDRTEVRFEIMRYLPDGWGAVVDKDIDGIQSRPLNLDREYPNLGRYSSCRRVARSIFIGSAPSVSAQRVRGIEEVRVKLGCVQPGESIPVFGDALRRLTEELTYLYSDATRFWFDTRPTINRIAADRSAQFERKPGVVEDEIIRRLKDVIGRDKGDFNGIHICPQTSEDILDEKECRLVILSPSSPHRSRSEESPAIETVKKYLEQRGNSPRLYRNMLVFIVADTERLAELQQSVRNWLAWTSIKQDEETLNLDVAQKRQVDGSTRNSEEKIIAQLYETYCYLFTPTQEGTNPIAWAISRLQGTDNFISRVSKKLKNDGLLFTEWNPILLRRELDLWLWKDKDHINVRQLWEFLAQYIYLPRLKSVDVLLDTIRAGVGNFAWKDFYAYASGINTEGKYLNLVAGSHPSITLDSESLLVKPEIAQRFIQFVEPFGKGPVGENPPGEDPGDEPESPVPPESAPKTTRFNGTIEIEPTRLGRDAGKISDEVITHLSGLVGANTKVTLEINIEVPEGIPEEKIRIISENCNTLKFNRYGFE